MTGAHKRYDAARRETVRYHEELYTSKALGEPGSWLARPHRLLADALAHLPCRGPVIAYDLGAGVGRHTIPMMQALPTGSEVYAVDLLEAALDRLKDSAPKESGVILHSRCADLVDFAFEADADIVLAFSSIEHLPHLGAVRSLLNRIEAALRPGGVAAIAIVADRFEVTEDGRRRPALLESEISSRDADRLLREVFGGYDVIKTERKPTEVAETRDGERYALRSTLVSWLAVKPRGSEGS